MANAIHVANNILKRGIDEGIDITPMKLQKLLYLVYKSYLKSTGDPLFPERIEAWRYGPVVKDVYDRFKAFGSNAIRGYGRDVTGSVFIVNEDSSEDFRNAIGGTWNKYKKADGISLAMMTHREGTAWRKTVEEGRRYIYDEDIMQEGELTP